MPRIPTKSTIGGANLRKQIENIRIHGVSPVVAINAFPGDFDSEHRAILEIAEDGRSGRGVHATSADGGKGAVELAEAVAEAADEPSDFQRALSVRGQR